MFVPFGEVFKSEVFILKVNYTAGEKFLQTDNLTFPVFTKASATLRLRPP